MKPRKAPDSLRRFTTIGSAIDTLRNKRVSFLDPEGWDDRNDAGYMKLYREACGCPSVKALCCTESPETYHHWKVFTTSSDGCFIDFYKKLFLKPLKNDDDYDYSSMEYVLLKELKGKEFEIRDLPFLKRSGFEAELEFRVIYTGACSDDVHFMPIELSWIRRIVLNPWLPPAIADSIAATLKEVSGLPDLTVTASRLTNSETWARYGKRVAGRGS